MIKVDQLMEINDLHRHGHSIRDIARITGHSRNTVRKVLRGEHDLRFHVPQRDSKIDAYKDYLKHRYQQHRLSAVRLIEEIRPMGYAGSIATLRRYLRTLRGEHHRQSRLTVRFETPPGRQAQADWAYCGKFPAIGSDGRTMMIGVYLFIMVLSYSRQMFIRFTTGMKMAQLIACHQQAFAYLGGVPATVLYDNMKQVRLAPGKLNEQFVDFARCPKMPPAGTCGSTSTYRPRRWRRSRRWSHEHQHHCRYIEHV
jgi:transposase